MVEICTNADDRRNALVVCNHRDTAAQCSGDFVVNHPFFQ